MIIDFHTHVFPDALAPRALSKLTEAAGNIYTPVTDMTILSLLSRMDEWGISRSVVLPVVTKQSQTVKLNEWAASIQSDRITAFGGFFPHSDDFRRDIDFVVSLGFKGIKLHPEYQDFVLDAPQMLKIYDYALSKGLILHFHAGFDPAVKPPFKSNPQMFAHIAREMRGGIIIAAHLGGHAQWNDVEKYIVGTAILLDTSMGFDYYGAEQFLRIVKNHGADKILFGSDSPWSNAQKEARRLLSLPLTDEQKNLILYKNALRVLNLRES